jgi:LytS/YehU family sensor histidine kinase
VIDSLGQESTIRVSPVVGDEVQKVVERAHDHFRTSVETLMQLTEEISDETHTKTLNTRLKEARDLLERATAYEIGLGMELDEVKAKIEAAKARIAERLLVKPAVTNTPEQTTPALAFLARSSGQLNLI